MTNLDRLVLGYLFHTRHVCHKAFHYNIKYTRKTEIIQGKLHTVISIDNVSLIKKKEKTLIEFLIHALVCNGNTI